MSFFEHGDGALLKEAYFDAIVSEGTAYACVEKNIRYMIKRLHQNNSETYRTVIGATCDGRPENATFLRTVAHYIKQHKY